jgi:hypothetical protein
MQFPCGRRIPGVHVCNTPAGAPTGIDLLYGFHQLVSRQGVDLAALETCISGMPSSSGRNCRRCSTFQATNLLIVSSHSCDFGVPASVARERTVRLRFPQRQTADFAYSLTSYRFSTAQPTRRRLAPKANRSVCCAELDGIRGLRGAVFCRGHCKSPSDVFLISASDRCGHDEPRDNDLRRAL